MRLALLLVLLAMLLLTVQPPAQDFPPEAPPVPSPELMLRAFGYTFDTAPLADVGEPVTIDFLCARLAGNTAQACESGMARLQTTLNNTGLGHVTARLVGQIHSTYASDGNITNDLSRVRNPSDGYGDDIMAMREAIGADCVVVLSPAGNYCGQAYLTAGASSCVAVVSQSCISNSSYEHEVGHNAGLSHDQPNASSAGYGGTSYGWCPVLPTGAQCGHKDVMVYPSPCGGSRIARFSNPRQFCPTHPTVPFGSATADGYSAWLNRAPVMANFRTPATPGVISAPSNHLPSSVGPR